MERRKYEAVQQGSELHNEDGGGGDDQEEIDIDLQDPEVEAAATKIQAGFKGHKARKEIQSKKDATAANAELNENHAESSEKDEKVVTKSETEDKEEIDIDLDDPEVEAAATKIQAGFKGHKARKEMKDKREDATKEEESNAGPVFWDGGKVVDEPDSVGAIAVGAGAIAVAASASAEEKKESGTEDSTAKEDDKRPDWLKSLEEPYIPPGETEEEEVVDIDLDDPEVEKAATKIQAGFKGHQARKEMREKTSVQVEDQAAEVPDSTGTQSINLLQLYRQSFISSTRWPVRT